MVPRPKAGDSGASGYNPSPPLLSSQSLGPAVASKLHTDGTLSMAKYAELNALLTFPRQLLFPSLLPSVSGTLTPTFSLTLQTPCAPHRDLAVQCLAWIQLYIDSDFCLGFPIFRVFGDPSIGRLRSLGPWKRPGWCVCGKVESSLTLGMILGRLNCLPASAFLYVIQMLTLLPLQLPSGFKATVKILSGEHI